MREKLVVGLILIIFGIFLLNVNLIYGEELKVTGEHPFYSYTVSDWVKVKDLNIGDKLLTSDGKNVIIKKITKVTPDEAVKVYNLQVGDVQDYYAGDVLVHNKPLVTNLKKIQEFENFREYFEAVQSIRKADDNPNNVRVLIDTNYLLELVQVVKDAELTESPNFFRKHDGFDFLTSGLVEEELEAMVRKRPEIVLRPDRANKADAQTALDQIRCGNVNKIPSGFPPQRLNAEQLETALSPYWDDFITSLRQFERNPKILEGIKSKGDLDFSRLTNQQVKYATNLRYLYRRGILDISSDNKITVLRNLKDSFIVRNGFIQADARLILQAIEWANQGQQVAIATDDTFMKILIYQANDKLYLTGKPKIATISLSSFKKKCGQIVMYPK